MANNDDLDELADIVDDDVLGDSEINTALAGVVAADSVDPETISLISRALKQPNGSMLMPTEAQHLLHQKALLVNSKLLNEEDIIVTTADGRSGMHFLNHVVKATQTPLITITGPRTGALYPGDEANYPGVALLKLYGAKKAKAATSTEANEQELARAASVTVWREVKLMPQHKDGLSRFVRGPVKGVDYKDIAPKLSLITFNRPASRKRKQPSLTVVPLAMVTTNGNGENMHVELGDVKQQLTTLRMEVQQLQQQVQEQQEQLLLLLGKTANLF